MNEHIEGGCFCGSIRYRFPINDYLSSNCHCSMCRSISGAPYVSWMAIPKDDFKKEQALTWLRDQGLGDIVKNNVSVSFGRGEDDKAKQLLDLAVSNGFEPQQKSDVAWNTLTALYQERVKAGLDMPSDVFSLWIKDKTKISRKK